MEYEHRSQYLHTMAQCMTDSMGLSATDTVCGIVPMFHAMGWGIPWSALMLGCKQVLPHRFMDPHRLAKLMADEGVTLSAGVPTIWQGVKATLEANPEAYDLSSLSRLTCGGSAPPKSLIRWYHDALGVEMIQGWGLTETSPLATLSRRFMKHKHLAMTVDEQLENVGKAGQLMPGLELDISMRTSNSLPHDGEAVGEILVRGPWICSEYYQDPQPERFHDGWLITGDVGRIDPEEYVIIADRSKDLVKSGGEWISSVDLENHIVAFPGIAQACVVAQPHPRWDERPLALIVLQDGAEISPQAILDHCSTRYAKWQLPDDICSSTTSRSPRRERWTRRSCAPTWRSRATCCPTCGSAPCGRVGSFAWRETSASQASGVVGSSADAELLLSRVACAFVRWEIAHADRRKGVEYRRANASASTSAGCRGIVPLLERQVDRSRRCG